MITEFQLNGLSLPNSFTCSNIGKEDIFWAKSNWPKDRFAALFKIAKDSEGPFFRERWRAEIEHDGLFEDGTPKNPVVISVREL